MGKSKEGMIPSEVLEATRNELEITPTPANTPKPATLGDPPLPVIGDKFSSALDEAARMLVSQLTPAIRDYVYELAKITLHIPLWQLVLGSLMAQYEAGTLQAPSIDPSWQESEVASLTGSICGGATPYGCKTIFLPKRYGQLFCSSACGDKARKAEIAERNRRRDEIQAKIAKLEKELNLIP